MDIEDKEDDDCSKKSNDEDSFDLVDSRDLDKEDLEAIKGDSIGDTIYSGKWIIKTLIALSKVYEDGWSQALESDLCTLWDMTAEKDIVLFLKENDFLKMAEFTLKISEEPRLTEIIIGIIGNMCCQPIVLEAVGETDNLTSLIFGLLSTNDTETLVQIVRLLKCSVLYIQTNPETKWLQRLKECEFFGDALLFILQSSTNEDLLTATVDLLKWISTVEPTSKNSLLANLIENKQLVPSLVESFMQLMSKEHEAHSRNDLKFIENWLSILSEIIESKLEINSCIFDNATRIGEVVFMILQPFAHCDNLFPLDNRVAPSIQNCIEILSWFESHNNITERKTLEVIFTIMHELRLAFREDCTEERIQSTEENKELLKYLERYCLVTLSKYSVDELMEILRLCRNDVFQCLMEVSNENSKEFPHAVSKLSSVKSQTLVH